MFWIAILGISFSWLLTKFGFLSATVGILTMVIKLLLIALLIGSMTAVWFWLRKKTSGAADNQ